MPGEKRIDQTVARRLRDFNDAIRTALSAHSHASALGRGHRCVPRRTSPRHVMPIRARAVVGSPPR